MTYAYFAVTILAATALAYAACLNFVRHPTVRTAAAHVQMSECWMVPLGAILATGAVGLLVGFAVPLIGTAAAFGAVVYFVCALGAHARVRDAHIGPAAAFLVLTTAALVTTLADRGWS